jgi:hypothetical protein
VGCGWSATHAARQRAPTPGQQGETLTDTGGALNDRCVVCDEIATQIRYGLPDGAVAFHLRCHDA